MRAVPTRATKGPLGGGHMLNRELLQDRRRSPRSTRDDSEQRSRSVEQHVQGRQQARSRFLHPEQVGPEKHKANANGLASPWRLTECKPGDEQREGGIEGEQGADQ